MESQYNREDIAPIRISGHHLQLRARNGIRIQRGSMSPQTFQATAGARSYSLTPDGKALLLKTQLPMKLNVDKSADTQLEASLFQMRTHGTRRNFACCQKRKQSSISLSYKLFCCGILS